jgi:hypothetical protein
MNVYDKFNKVFNINGVEFVDCRAYLKLDIWLYTRIGSDELSNTVDHCLTSDEVDSICFAQGIDYASLMTEDEINIEMSGGA